MFFRQRPINSAVPQNLRKPLYAGRCGSAAKSETDFLVAAMQQQTSDAVEILRFLTALLGVIAAIINYRRILALGHRGLLPGATKKSITSGRRFRRFLACLVVAFALPVLYGIVAGVSGTHETTDQAVADFLIWPTTICVSVAAYELGAMVVLMISGLWR